MERTGKSTSSETPSVSYRDQAIDRALAELNSAEGSRKWFLTADLPGGLTGTACAIRHELDDAFRDLRNFELEAVHARLATQPDKFPNVSRDILEKEVFSEAFLKDRAETQAALKRASQFPSQ